MKKIIFTLALLTSVQWLNAQSLERTVIAAEGRTFYSGTSHISYTIGESMTRTLNAGNFKLTQGFQQPAVATIIEEGDLSFEPSSSTGASLNCGEIIPMIEPIVISTCSEAFTLTYSDTSNNLICNTVITRTWTATDNCNNEAEWIQVFTYVDTTPPALVIPLEQEVYLSCDDEEGYYQPIFDDNCDEDVEVIHTFTTAEEGCGSVIHHSWEATDNCGNTFSFTINEHHTDNEEPVFTSCPDDITLQCVAEIPEAEEPVVTDNCDTDVEVMMEEFYLGNAPVEGALEQCSLLTPVRPANNPCGYPVDWAMSLFGLPKAHRHYYVSAGSFVRMQNGQVLITATLNNVYNPNSGWTMNVKFANEMTWAQWSTQNTPHSFKAGCGANAANHTSWLYYLLQNTPGAEFTGFGGYEGSSLNAIHAPLNTYFGFQLGDDANNYNGVEKGFGGWFTYSGNFKVNGVNYGTNGYINGAGDLAFELDCCPSYEMVRQWTAIDCSGNTTTCTQEIHIGSSFTGTNPQNMPTPHQEFSFTPEVLEISASPNPADHMVTFSFNTIESAMTTLDIITISGEKVEVIYNSTPEADTRQVLEYDTDELASGIYFYRLVNGASSITGKLVVTH